MSYLKNITNTMVENARSITRQESWPHHRSNASILRHEKLTRYYRQAGGEVFDLDSSPKALGVNLGWAGKKTKARMLETNRTERGRKEPKVWRSVRSIQSLRFYGLGNLIRKGATPTLPEGGLCTELAKYVIVTRNHNVGYLSFVYDNGMSIKVPYVLDKANTVPETVALWDGLTRMNRDGTQVPMFTPPRFGRRESPNRATGEAAAVRDTDDRATVL